MAKFNLNALRIIPRVNLSARRQDRVKMDVTYNGVTRTYNVGATVVDVFLTPTGADADGRRRGIEMALTGGQMRLAVATCILTTSLHERGDMTRQFPGTVSMVDAGCAEDYFAERSLLDREIEIAEVLAMWRDPSNQRRWQDRRWQASLARWNDDRKERKAAAAEEAAAAAAADEERKARNREMARARRIARKEREAAAKK